MQPEKTPGPKPQGKAPSQREKEKAYKSLQYWLARIYTRALADLLRGKKDV